MNSITIFVRLLITKALVVVGHGWWLNGVTTPGIQNGNRHSADGSVARNTKRPPVYIHGMAPHNYANCVAVLSGHFRSLLVQFRLTPKSKRGLAAREAVDPLGALGLRINRLRLRCFRFRKCKKLLHLTVGGVF